MKKTMLLIVLGLIIHTESFSQCLPDGITFSTQAEINNFQTDFPNCTEIEGEVFITGTDIDNLNGLNILTSIGGSLNVGSIDGGNTSLTSLSGLDNLTYIGGNVAITNNPSLKNVSSLSQLIEIKNILYIEDNPLLTDLSGFSNVSAIGGTLNISRNNSLKNLSGLDHLISIGGNLYIKRNDSLESLLGLDHLTSTGEIVWILQNATLSNLSGLNNLTTIGGELLINENAILTSLTGIENIDPESISYLSISENSQLSFCEVQSICDYLDLPAGQLSITNNYDGCNTPSEVRDACQLVNVSMINAESDIQIYPNPAKTEIFILSKNEVMNYKATVYNQFGQMVLFQETTTQKIDISMLTNGFYFIEFNSDNLKIRKKIIIE